MNIVNICFNRFNFLTVTRFHTNKKVSSANMQSAHFITLFYLILGIVDHFNAFAVEMAEWNSINGTRSKLTSDFLLFNSFDLVINKTVKDE